MFDFDLGKIMLFGVVALVVVGPKDLPAVLRVAGRLMAQFRRLQRDIRGAFDTMTAETALASDAIRVNLALNPATAMRGSLSTPSAGTILAAEAMEYASPEMQAYLAPLEETGAPTAEHVG